MKNIKYNININQLALSELSNDMDITDASILDYIYVLCGSMSEKVESRRIKDKNGIWTWVDYHTLLEQMPLLRIKSPTALGTRIRKIEKNGFITTQKKRISGHISLYVKLDRLIDSLYVKLDRPIRLDAQAQKDENLETLISSHSPEKPKRLNAPIINSIHNSTSDNGAPSPLEVETNRVIELFHELNPNWMTFFKPGPQRSSVHTLIKWAREGDHNLGHLIKVAKELHGIDFEPQIHTPADMVEKFSKLLASDKKRNGNWRPNSVFDPSMIKL